MNNLETLTDYDQVNGFAQFHILAFEEIKRVTVSRHKSFLFNPTLIDTNNINNATGGFDLSRVKEWNWAKSPSKYYALWQITERQSFSKDSFFESKWKQSRDLYNAYMEKADVPFDMNNDRVQDTSRTLSTFKISRA